MFDKTDYNKLANEIFGDDDGIDYNKLVKDIFEDDEDEIDENNLPDPWDAHEFDSLDTPWDKERYEAECKKHDQEELEKLERKAFHDSPKNGVNAHAYNKKYDNIKIYQLKKQGYSFRKIAEILGIASPSTVRNRYNKLEREDQSLKYRKTWD